MAVPLEQIELADIVLDVNGDNLPAGKPRKTRTPCSCGGTLKYGVHPLNSYVNGEIVRLPAVHQFRCSLECGVILLQPEVAREIRNRVIAARVKPPLEVIPKTLK